MEDIHVVCKLIAHMNYLTQINVMSMSPVYFSINADV